jgi:GTP:adenosylcobinamide-phosphate guanylyltransferase
MDAIVTAGGIPKPEEPLYPYTQGSSKALLDVAGKPMVQWCLDALGGAKDIEHVIVMGLEASSGVTCAKPLTFIPNQGSMLENILGGIKKVLEINPTAHHALIVSSDIPGITPAMVDWVVETCMQTDDDVYYNVIKREVMEARYPGSKRSFTRLKDVEVCGGDMNVVRTMTVNEHRDTWDRIIESRKSAAKQAALIGYDTLILFLLRMVTMDQAVQRVCKRLKLKGRAVVCPYAEVGMDVDKPHQLEMMRLDLAKKATQ